MITALHRFHGYASLKTVYRNGQTVRSSQMSLKFSWRNNQKPYRAAVVVSKKVHKSAVVRNRIRRRIFECIRLVQNDIPNGLDMAFMVYSEEVATQTTAQLQESVATLIQKASHQNPQQ